MRNLAIRFALWLCRVLGIVALDPARMPMGDPVARGERWHSFYHEEGGLADMLSAIRREAFEAAGEIDPRETDKIYYWAMADRNVRKLEARIRTVIETGKIAAKAREVSGQGMPRKSVY